MSENGHAPAIDLAEVMARTAPPRTIRLPREMLDVRNITTMELGAIGRALGMTPQEITTIDAKSWDGVDLQQALVWVVLRREEPELTWQEAQRFALELAPPLDRPTPASAGASRTRGTRGRSSSTARPGSRPSTPAR